METTGSDVFIGFIQFVFSVILFIMFATLLSRVGKINHNLRLIAKKMLEEDDKKNKTIG